MLSNSTMQFKINVAKLKLDHVTIESIFIKKVNTFSFHPTNIGITTNINSEISLNIHIRGIISK
jgi:hypothetical protein